MKRFIEGENRLQSTLFPERLDDYIAEDNAVRVVDAFVEKLDLLSVGFEGIEPSATGRPAYHPAVLLKLYIYGYLNGIQSGRRLEREAQRNVELIWLTGRLMPVFKTIEKYTQNLSLSCFAHSNRENYIGLTCPGGREVLGQDFTFTIIAVPAESPV